MLKKPFNWFIVSIICIVPLIITPWNLDYYYGPKIKTIYVLCILASIYFLILHKRLSYKIVLTDKLVLLYFFFIALSTVFSVNFSRSLSGRPLRLEGFWALSSYILIYFAASKFYEFKKSHLVLLFLSSAIISCYAIAQYAGFEPIPVDTIRNGWHDFAYATLGNPNFLGSYLTLILPISIFSYVYSKKIIYLLTSGLLYVALLCTRTRSAWLGTLIALVFLLWLVIRRRINLKHVVSVFLFLIVLTLSFNYFSGNAASSRAVTIVQDAKSVVTGSPDYKSAGSHRIFIWSLAVKLLFNRPLTGYGPDTFDIAFMGKYDSYILKNWGSIYIDKAHNEYLQIGVTTGLPSLAAYLSFIALVLMKAIRGKNKNILIIPLLCSITGYLCQAFFNISVVSVAPVYWAFLGILTNFSEPEMQAQGFIKSPL